MSANKELSGRIFNIQKYSIYDGDGIRTLIFLKAAIFAARGVPTGRVKQPVSGDVLSG